MNTEHPFIEFPKLARLNRECVITEKIDGTNACIYITDEGEFFTGSRTRWITPVHDNFGFSAWAHAHKDELMLLGPGRHFGEWWGSGIQRGYGLAKGEKRFSLFNTVRWNVLNVPPCCSVVPVIRQGLFSTDKVLLALEQLRMHGSLAAPGFTKPEGIVVFHTAANQAFKVTLEKDEQPKSTYRNQNT